MSTLRGTVAPNNTTVMEKVKVKKNMLDAVKILRKVRFFLLIVFAIDIDEKPKRRAVNRDV